MIEEMDKNTFNSIIHYILNTAFINDKGEAVDTINTETLSTLTALSTVSSKDFKSVIKELINTINKTNISKLDILNTSKEILKEQIIPDVKSNVIKMMNAEDASITDKIKDVFENIFSSIFDFADKIVIYFISIMIVAHMQIRSKLPSGYFFPDEASKFPYIYYDNKSKSKIQSNSISIEKNSTFNSGGPVFQKMKENNTYANDTNDTNDTTNQMAANTYFKNQIQFEHMNFFAKKFIELNIAKTQDELTLYGMLFYVLTYSCIQSNSVLGNIHNLANNFLKHTFSDKPTILNHLISTFFILIFYYIFKKTSTSWSKLMQKILLDYSSNIFENDGFSILNKTLDIISGFFSPFIFFFKVFFLLLYPISCLFCIFGFVSFASISNSIIIQLVCYFGVASAFVLSIWTLLTTFKSAYTNGTFSVTGLFDTFMSSTTSIISESATSLTKTKTDFSDEINDLGLTENFTTLNKKHKKRSKLKSFILKSFMYNLFMKKEGFTEMDCDNCKYWWYNESKCKTLCKEYNDAGKKEEEAQTKVDELNEEAAEETQAWIDKQVAGDDQESSIASNLFSNNDVGTTSCAKFSDTWETIKTIIYDFFIIICAPIVILLSFLPIMVTLYLSFYISKQLTIDYVYYICDIFSNISKSIVVVRSLFYLFLFMEMLTSINRKKYISIGVLTILLLLDVFRFGSKWKETFEGCTNITRFVKDNTKIYVNNNNTDIPTPYSRKEASSSAENSVNITTNLINLIKKIIT